MLIWLGGFGRPVLELSLFFWLVMIGFGFYFGLRFEDVDSAQPEEPESFEDKPHNEEGF